MLTIKGKRSAWRARRSDLRRLERSGTATVGVHTYGNPRILTFKHDATRLKIGSFCSIGEGVTFILGGGHPTNEVTTFPLRIRLGMDCAGDDSHPLSRGDIEIGSDVWIGAGATILSGVTIGHGAIIGAQSLVSRDVSAFSIVTGNPAKEMRKRLPVEQIASLLRIRWWEWDDAKVRGNVSFLSSSDVEQFIAEFEK